MSNSGTRALASATYAERARLHSEVDDTTGCWLWRGYVRSGSPYVAVKQRHAATHIGAVAINLRAAILTEQSGRPNDAYCAIATCGQRLCVNPQHLNWETHAEFRQRCRDTQPAKLSLADLARAYDDRQKGASVIEIAAAYGMSRQGLYRQWRKWGFDVAAHPV